uniref:Uncharacterized protein n=1 Tax=Panagrolaimus sp. PS1159 TaxID=55785 RepID=A0AC35F412_9BILA
MKVIFGILFVFSIKNEGGYCQYGVYGGVQFQQPTGYQNYPQQRNIGPNSGYGYGYGPYSNYGPNNYVNSNYGNSQQPNLGAVLGDVSLAILRSLGEMLMGPEPDPIPYGPPQGPFQPRNRGQNQFGYGVNAGVYAGTYGGSGQSVAGPYGDKNSHIGYGVNAGVYAGTYGGGGQSVAGPYGNKNSHIGSSYSGLSGWPVLP